MTHRLSFIPILILLAMSQARGQNIGINTLSPAQHLSVHDLGNADIRIHSTNEFGSHAGVELLRGTNFSAALDWRILNLSGKLTIASGNYNQELFSDEHVRIIPSGKIGLGTNTPASTLNVTGGFGNVVKLGTSIGQHLTIGVDQIQSNLNGGLSPLHIQSHGGNTFIAHNGGTVSFANQSGTKFGIGTTSPAAKVSIVDDGWQIYLRNDGGDVNDWYIGASGDNWSIGDDQLVFSPTSFSGDAPLRLHTTNENDGNIAPVAIHSGAQRLLLDGNEIDANSSLHINHNTNQDIRVNAQEGSVGIGTTSITGKLTVTANPGGFAMALQRDADIWYVQPYANGNLAWRHSGLAFAQISAVNGQWLPLSDQRFKKDVKPIENVLDRIGDLDVMTYHFKHDTTTRRHIGILAQQAELIFPEIVEETDGQYGVAYGELAVIAIRALQEQQVLVDELKHEITRIKQSLTQNSNSPNAQSNEK